MWVHEQPLSASSWCLVTLLNCRNLFLHDSSPDCIASYCKSVISVSICSFHRHVFFLLLPVEISPAWWYSHWVQVIHIYMYITFYCFVVFCFYFPVEVPVVLVNPCWNCKASVLPYDPWHLISERSALKRGFHLILKLALQQADKNRFFKKRFYPQPLLFSFNQAKPLPEAY